MGPLSGVRVIEMGGIGPSPFAAMLLSDLGAEVIRIDRASAEQANPFEVTLRARKCMALNIKSEAGVEVVIIYTLYGPNRILLRAIPIQETRLGTLALWLPSTR